MYSNFFTNIFACFITDDFVEQVVKNTLLEFAEEPNTTSIRQKICDRVKSNLGILAYVYPICDTSNNLKEIIDNDMIVLDLDYRVTTFHNNKVKQFILHKYPWKPELSENISSEDKLSQSWVEVKTIHLKMK